MVARLELSSDGSPHGLWPDPWPDEALRQARLRSYHALNAAFDRPLALHLTRRGFFSEVNCALDAVLFALAEQRRLAVVERRFNKLRWRDYFAGELPFVEETEVEAIPPDDQIFKPKEAAFQRVQVWLRNGKEAGLSFGFHELGVEGNLFEAKRALYRMFCRPAEPVEREADAAMARLELEAGRYAAVHMRRGDKVKVIVRKGKLWAEGEDTPAERVAEIVERLSPDTRDVFVLTDDFASVDDLRRASPGRRIVTLCPPDAAGHTQDGFNSAPREVKTAIIRRLVVECVIAARSDAFAGGFKSNVARFVASIHHDPGRCASTDSRPDPWPH